MKGFELSGTKALMPGLGFGTWQIPKETVGSLVQTALNCGYTHIDCAHVYQNEYELGRDVFSKITNRDKLFITSKLWGSSHEPSRVRQACELTLKNLQCNYLDLYLIHNPCRMGSDPENMYQSLYFKREWIAETWREMEKLVEAGLCKHVGVSNFTTKKLTDLLDDCSVKPTVNQVELHPYLRQDKLLKYCADKDILLTAYSPLGTPGTRETVFGNMNAPILLEDPVINKVAKAKSATPAQVLIAWGLARGTVVLVKSSSEARMKENLLAAELTLTDQEMKEIDSITTKERYLSFDLFLPEGKTVDDYWDGEMFN